MVPFQNFALSASSRTNANDRFAGTPFGRAEGGDGIVEGRDRPDVGPESSIAETIDDLSQLSAVGLDNEVDGKAVSGSSLGRPDDGHQRSSRSDQARGLLRDVAADDIEHQVDATDVFERVVL
jgi:hypothetical protein